jgi:hypothetical protein
MGFTTSYAQSALNITTASDASLAQDQGPRTAVAVGNGIYYNNGPVMAGPHNVYYIWYGNWSGNSALTILPAFVSALNGSPYFSINTTYSNGVPQSVSNNVTLAGQIFDSYSQGTALNESGIQSIVTRAMNSGLGTDPNGIYVVLTSADVSESSFGGFCVKQCGWHHFATLNGADIKYAFVGNDNRCANPAANSNTCMTTNISVSPNNDPGVDAMASVIAHELSETVTDPHINAWLDGSFPAKENADKCAYDYGTLGDGTVFVAPNGSLANISLAGMNFLVQKNWVNDGGGYCAMRTTGNPFSYRRARDLQLACYGIAVAPAFPTNCNDISEANDKQMCSALSQYSQTPCQTITDRNLQLACYGMALSPSTPPIPSNCNDIADPQMKAFCYGVSSRGADPSCANLTDPNTRSLCNGLASHDSSYCSAITNTNDRQFCTGVTSRSQSPCVSIQ